jgi:hypothetical protein
MKKMVMDDLASYSIPTVEASVRHYLWLGPSSFAVYVECNNFVWTFFDLQQLVVL